MGKSTFFNIIVGLGFLLAAVFVVAVGIIINRTLHQLVETVESISEPAPVVKQLRKVQSGIADSEKTLRAYSITQNREYFSLYVKLQQETIFRLKALKEKSEGLPEDIQNQIATIDKLLQHRLIIINEYLHSMGEEVVDQVNIQNENFQLMDEAKNSNEYQENGPEGKAKEDLMVEIEQVIEQQRQREIQQARALAGIEIELAERDRQLTEELQIAIASIEESLTAYDAQRTEQARESAFSAIKLITGFVVAGLIGAIFLVFFIIKYNIKSNLYKEKLIAERNNAEKNTKLKEEFMANMSHEIRTPMNVIMGFTEQLLKPGQNINQNMYLKGIRRSTEHLLRLINDILDYSKIESGKLSIERIGFRWKDILDDVYLLLRDKAEEKNIEFGYLIKDKIPDILVGDPVRLKQILLNLVDNAIKFTHQGEVQIICEQGQDQGFYLDLKFTVKDTGIGINKNKVQDIFEDYSQAESGTTRKFGGSGLGLSISKKLVELQGGQIYVKSIEGKGSEFIFVLPYKKGLEADVNVEKAIEGVPVELLTGKKVLVVDDEEFNRQLAKIILEQYGVIVTEAENGLSALEKIEQQDFDAVLMDIQMPGLNGLEIVKRVRQMDYLP
ncbi:MAG: response regulator, partial [Bacteroidetes bacterium]|nr:response regulator [Bacteroidota bacterium]